MQDDLASALATLQAEASPRDYNLLVASLSLHARQDEITRARRVLSAAAGKLSNEELESLWQRLADTWMSTAQAAAYIGYGSASSVRSAVCRGQLTPDAFVGRQPRFKRSSLVPVQE